MPFRLLPAPVIPSGAAFLSAHSRNGESFPHLLFLHPCSCLKQHGRAYVSCLQHWQVAQQGQEFLRRLEHLSDSCHGSVGNGALDGWMITRKACPAARSAPVPLSIRPAATLCVSSLKKRRVFRSVAPFPSWGGTTKGTKRR